MEWDWAQTLAEEEEEEGEGPFPRTCTLGALSDFKESCLSTGVCVSVCVDAKRKKVGKCERQREQEKRRENKRMREEEGKRVRVMIT